MTRKNNLQSRRGKFVFSTLTLAFMSSVPALGAWQPPGGPATGAIPPYQNLISAKQLVNSVAMRIQRLINRTQGLGRGGENSGPRRRPVGSPAFGLMDSIDDGAVQNAADGMVDENDNAALFALQGMGAGIYQLGALIDQMTAAYGTPMFFNYWQQSCQRDGALIGANQAAKVAAALPVMGMVTPNDFVPNDTELWAVRTQLWCP